MELRENLLEGLKSINANRLRSVLTALIIAIGITSLVGILTAIDGIQASVSESFSNLGANTFEIRDQVFRDRRSGGIVEKVYPPLRFKEVMQFEETYSGNSITTIQTDVTGIAEIKYGSEVTNPNVQVSGGGINFLRVRGYDLKSGRNFSLVEVESGSNVVIIGHEIYQTLFGSNKAINKEIGLLGGRFRVIGILSEQGGVGGIHGADRIVIIPLETARKFGALRNLRYQISVLLTNPLSIDQAMSEATGVMRNIRQDHLGEPNSFEIVKSQSLADRFDKITGYLRIGGFSIGFITLIGASIGLMNIMLVSVTERTREIGIRKALGATPKKIRQQFLIEAVVLTQLGGIGGVILGILTGNIISTFLSDGNFLIPWLWILLGLVVAALVGVFSGYIPAYKASRLDPIESLRYE